MPRLTRYVLTQLLGASAALIAVICAVIWLSQSVRFVDWMVNRGLPVSTFLYIALLVLPNFLIVLLPLAVFAAVLFTYSKLQTDSELIVMRAVGVGPGRMMAPALITAAIGTLFAYALTLYILPTAYRSFKQLQLEMRNGNSGLLLQEGVFTTLDQGLTMFVREQGQHGELEGILLQDERRAEKPVTMTADSGALVATPAGPRIIMEHGNRQELNRETGKVTFLFFDHYTLDLAHAGGEGEGARQHIATERYLDELLDPQDVTDPRLVSALRAEGHQRLVAPLFVPAFVMLALAALLSGNFSRRGQAARVMTAVAAVVVIEAAGIGLGDMSARSGAMIPLMYGNVVLPIVLAAYILAADPGPARAIARGLERLRR